MAFLNMREILQVILAEFYSKIASIDHFVPREARFWQVDIKIKVAMGIRRSGKTVFCYQTISWLLGQAIQQSRILYINFEDDRL